VRELHRQEEHMPQLEEDEWPADEEPTTTEQEHLKDGGPKLPRGQQEEAADVTRPASEDRERPGKPFAD
jgi:hypothetical protein